MIAERDGGGWKPVAPAERIFVLDALRGVSVLGLLVANIALFAYPTAKATSMEGWSGIDAALRLAVGALVEGKFYTLFSILFGGGCWMLCRSPERCCSSR